MVYLFIRFTPFSVNVYLLRCLMGLNSLGGLNCLKGFPIDLLDVILFQY